MSLRPTLIVLAGCALLIVGHPRTAPGQAVRTDPNGDYDVAIEYTASGDGVTQVVRVSGSVDLKGKKLKLKSPGRVPGTGNLKLGDKVKSSDNKVNTSLKGKLKKSAVGGLNLKSGKLTVKTTRNGKFKLNAKADGKLLSNRRTEVDLKLSGKSS